MKKNLLAVTLLAAGAVLLAAQDIDTSIKNAVDGLASRLNTVLEMSIGDITLAGTDTVSALSRNLQGRIEHHASNNPRMKVVARSRGLNRASDRQKGIIRGTFVLEGDMVRVTIKLVSDPDGVSLGSREFTIPVAELDRLGIAILPDNIKDQNDAEDKEKIISVAVPDPAPVPSPSTPVPAVQSFRLEAWPNSESRTYFDGEELKISLWADRDCYVKVYHIDVNGAMQLLYPNSINRNNFLPANAEKIIPEPGTTRINIEAPYGQETILVFASTRQFPGVEAEFQQVRQAGRETLRVVSRGARLQDVSGTLLNAETRFNITILPPDYADEVFNYRKPADMAAVVQTLRAQVLMQGGTFNGNEREGSFTANGVQSTYRVSGDTVTMILRYQGNQSSASVSRGAGTAFNFSFDKPRNISQAVQSIRAGIENKGGAFSGNEREGNFRASGIAGQYHVAEKVSVTIHEKPFIIPNSMIEREVKNYFTGQ
jgi:hypothetical protein